MGVKLSEIRKYINAGLSDEQIASLVKGSEKKEEPQQKAGKEPDFASLAAAITELKETIQASNLKGLDNPEPQTIDEILESLIIEE